MRPWFAVMLCVGCAGGGAAPTTVGDDPAPAAPDADVKAPGEPHAVDETDGALSVHPVQHGTFYLQHEGRTIWVDPWTEVPLDGPKADIVLVTDVHPDHLDPAGVAAVRKADTVVVGPAAVGETLPLDVVLANGETREVEGIRITAVPMYNLERGPEPGRLYHDKGRGNGYLLDLGQTVYIAGDTACTPEMKALEGVDVAFVPMNLPYTMTPAEAADCIEAFRPGVVYPYHYRGSDLSVLEERLEDDPDIALELREWYPGDGG